MKLPTVSKLRAAAVLLLATTALVLACGEDHTPNRPGSVTTAVRDSLTFTRADTMNVGPVEMGSSPLVCCGLYDPSFVNERAMRIVMYDPANQKAGWQILILIDRAQQGETVTLPTTVVAPSKVERISMFVADIPTGNELSSESEGSTGTITVHSFRCTATAIQIRFSVDAVLGSEFWDGPSMTVHGSFEGTFPKQSCI